VPGELADLRGAGLVIFDCDGVLVDTERLITVVEARVITELGWPMDQAEVVRRWMGRSAAEQHREVAERLGDEVAGLFAERVHEENAAAEEAELAAVEGVAELVDALDAAGVPTCVASSGTHDRMRRTLGLTGLWDRFEGRIFSASEVEHGKPAPDLFLHAARQMGVDPARTVVIEDSVPGVLAGIAAGMTVLGYGGSLVDPALLAEAGATVFPTMAGLAP